MFRLIPLLVLATFLWGEQVATARQKRLGHSAYHISYGLGFLPGIRWFVSAPVRHNVADSVFTRITR